MTHLARLWRGELPLASAFWDWAVIGGIVVNGAATILFFVMLMHDHAVIGYIVTHVLPLPYNVVVGVGVWRSAGRYKGNRRWATAARIVTA